MKAAFCCSECLEFNPAQFQFRHGQLADPVLDQLRGLVGLFAEQVPVIANPFLQLRLKPGKLFLFFIGYTL